MCLTQNKIITRGRGKKERMKERKKSKQLKKKKKQGTNKKETLNDKPRKWIFHYSVKP